MIFDRRLENHAVGELINHAALDLLPRRLARRIFVALLLLQRGAALRELGVRDQHVGAALVEVDAHAVAVLSNASPPPAAASGEALMIDGEAEVPDWRPSPMQGSEVMPRLIKAAGGCMFTTSAEPG